jgi:hypothetical protein
MDTRSKEYLEAIKGRTQKLKLRCLMPPASWDVDLAVCVRSEKLMGVVEQKLEDGTFSEQYVIEGMKSMLFAKVVLYLLSYKTMDPPKIVYPLTQQTRNLLSKPQSNILKGLVFGSDDMKGLMEFQKEYRVQGLDDLLSFFIAEGLQSMGVAEVNEGLGMKGDFTQAEHEMIDKMIQEASWIA